MNHFNLILSFNYFDINLSDIIQFLVYKDGLNEQTCYKVSAKCGKKTQEG
jgi:hypothetical protein